MDDLILSQDGSHTVLSQKFGVSYHSKYGAVQETQTVFIDAGLKFQIQEGKKNISILEMGFGTGLNALMTILNLPLGIIVNYNTIEAYPLEENQFTNLNYPSVLNLNTQNKEAFLKMHFCQWTEVIPISDNFIFTKYLQKIEEFRATEKYDIIYYDAFGPSSQEELWSEKMMIKLYELCNPEAVLVTYCAKGSFKRALKSAGFTLETLDGPVGKREMTRAHKSIIL